MIFVLPRLEREAVEDSAKAQHPSGATPEAEFFVEGSLPYARIELRKVVDIAFLEGIYTVENASGKCYGIFEGLHCNLISGCTSPPARRFSYGPLVWALSFFNGLLTKSWAPVSKVVCNRDIFDLQGFEIAEVSGLLEAEDPLQFTACA